MALFNRQQRQQETLPDGSQDTLTSSQTFLGADQPPTSQPDQPPTSQPDQPPKRTRRSRKTQSHDGDLSGSGTNDRAPRRASRKAELNTIAERLTMLLGAVSLAAGMFNARDGRIIDRGTDRLVTALIHLAEQDKRVYLLLQNLAVGGAYSEVTIAALAIIIPIMVNHNLLPPLFAITVPEDDTSADNTIPNA